jgi:hypothetical protein
MHAPFAGVESQLSEMSGLRDESLRTGKSATGSLVYSPVVTETQTRGLAGDWRDRYV